MSAIQIELDGERLAFRPEDAVSGTLRWDLPKGASWIAVRLFWWTEGKGDRDVGVVTEDKVERPDGRGEHSFSFQLPRMPYSFSGKLVSILWGIEVEASTRETELVEIVMGPESEEVRADPGPRGAAA